MYLGMNLPRCAADLRELFHSHTYATFTSSGTALIYLKCEALGFPEALTALSALVDQMPP